MTDPFERFEALNRAADIERLTDRIENGLAEAEQLAESFKSVPDETREEIKNARASLEELQMLLDEERKSNG